MAAMAKRFPFRINSFLRFNGKSHNYQHLLTGLLNRRLSQQHQGEDKRVGTADSHKDSTLQHSGLLKSGYDPELIRESSDDDDSSWQKWRVELSWLSKALEPALRLYKWASTAGIGEKPVIPPSTRSLFEILTDLQVSKAGIQEWSLSDLTVGLYLIHLSQASAAKVEDFKGVQINCESMDFKLRLVGHSLGGAAAALLAIMLRRKSAKELGFSPNIISAVGFGTPPCVSKELAESCASYVSTVVLQDDIVPRLSVASLARLRNEILETDWMTILEMEDWKRIVELVANAKNVVSSVQDVAQKFAAYATKFRKLSSSSDIYQIKEPIHQEKGAVDGAVGKQSDRILEELFLPGTQYFLRREIDEGHPDDIVDVKSKEFYTLWRRNPGEHFRRILLSGNLISDHKCDNHYFALRDVLKGLPASESRTYF